MSTDVRTIKGATEEELKTLEEAFTKSCEVCGAALGKSGIQIQQLESEDSKEAKDMYVCMGCAAVGMMRLFGFFDHVQEAQGGELRNPGMLLAQRALTKLIIPIVSRGAEVSLAFKQEEKSREAGSEESNGVYQAALGEYGKYVSKTIVDYISEVVKEVMSTEDDPIQEDLEKRKKSKEGPIVAENESGVMN